MTRNFRAVAAFVILCLTPASYARYYDPEYGRFLSRDEMEGKLDEAPSLHRYSYAHANPVRYIDPDGHRAKDEIEAAKIAALLELAAQKEKAATLGERFEAFLAKGNPFAPPRDARALRKYADRWSGAIEKASDGTVVVIRESDQPGSHEKVNSLLVADFHLRMQDADGNDFVLDTGASFETAPEYEAKNRDLAFISALENGPNNGPFNRLASSLPGGQLPGSSAGGAKNMSSRSPGPPPARLQRSAGTRWSHGTASERAKWNVQNLQQGGGLKSGVPHSDFQPGNVTEDYVRPRAAGPTAAQRQAVQGQPCVDCGLTTPRQVADHKDPLSVEHFRTGTIDVQRQSSVEAVQPHCPTCSSVQGGQLSSFVGRMRKLLDL